MESGIYCLAWGKSKYFYIGKSDNIPKRWKQHQRSFEQGKHARKMQDQYDREGPPTYSVFLRCHMDHIDLYESIIIRANLGPKCLNGALPRLVPPDEVEILVNASEYIEQSTAHHIKTIDTLKAELSATTTDLELLKSTGIRTPQEIQQELEALMLAVSTQRRELHRLKGLGLWDRIFNFK